jgi:transcriptional regulator with XRE-family HTH domain
MIDLKLLGNSIRQERKSQLLTIEKLSENAGISENFLGKIERGDCMPSLQTIDNIACALNVSIDFLMGKIEYSKEHNFVYSLIEINSLSEQNREKFIDFIGSTIKYFK